MEKRGAEENVAQGERSTKEKRYATEKGKIKRKE
jgi:hypothetical protein